MTGTEAVIEHGRLATDGEGSTTIMSCTGRYAKIETDGYSIHRAALTTDAISELGAGLDHLVAGDAKYGIRNLLAKAPEIRDLANAPRIKALIDPVLGPNAFPVRAILFDKVPAANWGVSWHQDLTIAVKKRSISMVTVPGRSRRGCLTSSHRPRFCVACSRCEFISTTRMKATAP